MPIDATQPYDDSNIFARILRGELPSNKVYEDAHVLAFASHLRPRDRVRGFTTKAFLKRYARAHLPRAFVTRRKRGLSVPLGSWLRGPLHDWARARLAACEFASAGLKTERVLDWFDEHAARRRDHARGLSALLALAEWSAWVRDLDTVVTAAGFGRLCHRPRPIGDGYVQRR